MRKLFSDMPLPFKLFVWSFVALMLLLVLGGCDQPTRQERFEINVEAWGGTPTGATNLVYLDSDWYTFEWRGQCFLASNSFESRAGTGLLAKVDCVKE